MGSTGILLMIEILHDLIYENPRNYGSIVSEIFGDAGFISSTVFSYSFPFGATQPRLGLHPPRKSSWSTILLGFLACAVVFWEDPTIGAGLMQERYRGLTIVLETLPLHGAALNPFATYA